jgi:hypothetical protein
MDSGINADEHASVRRRLRNRDSVRDMREITRGD